jgi:SAM-dependent methyltransferase
MIRASVRVLPVTALVVSASVAALGAQTAPRQYEPKIGQPGKDVVWVPNPPEMVEKMLDLARVTPKDLVVDLGSGDGRNVIAAARRGARGRGVEFNPDLVEYSKHQAQLAGVADKATFVQGDMYEADFSDATVLALFLLPENLRKLMPKFVELEPGTRIVANTFGLPGWTPESTVRMEDGCRSWCEAMLYIVPAHVQGVWRADNGTLEFRQEHQAITGTLTDGDRTTPIENGTLRLDEITFTIAGATYTGRVQGDRIEGSVTTGDRQMRFTAVRQQSQSREPSAARRPREAARRQASGSPAWPR